MRPLGIYVHVPFCVRKCAYCDFNAYSGMGDLADSYVDAVCQEIGAESASGRVVETIFFGGGTPSYLSGAQLARILSSIEGAFEVSSDAEISAEANPGSSDAERFAAMRRAGFNRLSIGVQAFDDGLLRLVDRIHTASEAERAVGAARAAGFRNVSVDLMFGLPTQTLDAWKATLDRAIAMRTEHVSVYALTIEPGTRFERLHAGGKLELPDEDAELAMYEAAIARLTGAGFEHYEVSNFARPGFRARHNLVYWRNGEYLGFGPGAVSYRDGRRWKREKHPARYIAAIQAGRDPTCESERLDPDRALGETLMLGLRMLEGVRLSVLRERFGSGPMDCLHGALVKLEDRGLVELREDALRLTHTGLLFANDVALELL